MSTTRREILKAAPLALLSGGFAIPLLSAFTDDDLKKAEKGKLIKQETKSVEVESDLPRCFEGERTEWPVFAVSDSTLLTLGPALINGHECEIVGVYVTKGHSRLSRYFLSSLSEFNQDYLLRFKSTYKMDRTQQHILTQTI